MQRTRGKISFQKYAKTEIDLESHLNKIKTFGFQYFNGAV